VSLATLRNDSAESFHSSPRVETDGKSLSLRCLNEAIDHSAIPAKTLADEVGVSEGEFSKLRAGRFRLEHLDRLPPEVIADWQQRLEAARGELGQSREEVVMARAAHALIDALAVLRTGRRMVKARL